MTQPSEWRGRLKDVPPAYDKARVARAMADLEAWAKENQAAGSFADGPVKQLLAAAFGNSPYLTRLVLRDPEVLVRVLSKAPEAGHARILAQVTREVGAAADTAAVMRALRRAKHEMALLVALADLGGVWPVLEVTDALTRFADACLGAAVGFLLRTEADAGRIVGPAASEGSGFIVLAMGKYGAGELNYSSDIDLIVFFEAEQFRVPAGQDAQSAAVRITKALVQILAEHTADGYVFRTDLRLRPDAGATQIALSTEGALLYYEGTGQNWERAAMIKARPCAGDIAAGEAFLTQLKPFLWRRNLDFAAIEDIHSIKRQIHAHGGHGVIAVAGHNIKLGRGGIREIEFFVQTQQLILGGREPQLRGRTTCGMLTELARLGLISSSAAHELTDAYLFLRLVEHRLQMVEDSQTHTLPRVREELDQIARFCGFAETRRFEEKLRLVLETVQTHYAALFEHSPTLTESEGSLVFTGVDEDPETVETLTRMGFKRAADVSALIRSWHHGRLRATRSERARELLTRLVPLLLRALSRTGDPDTAFVRFHQFLEGLPAGVQLFSLLIANPGLLDMLSQCLGMAPRLAGYLARNNAVIDAMLDAAFADVLPSPEELTKGLARALGDVRDYQDVLDVTRRYAREQNFRVGYQILTGVADADAAGAAFANVAETVVRSLLPPTVAELAERHGTVRGGALCVLALGKLGSREMSAASDLDLIFIFDARENARSSGRRPLAATDYFARLAQRMVNALTVPTAEGKLYEVDMRLRPSGNAGPVAVQLSGFEHYQRAEAWTWEHLALTRARPIAGDAKLGARLSEIIRGILATRRDTAKIAADVVEMRQKIADNHASQDPWELKYVRGGLVDLEFIAQYLQLIHGSEHPDVLVPGTRQALRAMAHAGLLPPAAADVLDRAGHVLHTILQVLRVAVDGPFVPKEASPGLAALLCKATGEPSLTVLERALIEAEREVHALFGALVEQAR